MTESQIAPINIVSIPETKMLYIYPDGITCDACGISTNCLYRHLFYDVVVCERCCEILSDDLSDELDN